jgi:Antibiotic biosynthesis monooxygenase
MIAVIFEVWPKPDKKQNYLDIAAALRPILERIDGFISIERFESLTRSSRCRFSAKRQPSPLGARLRTIAGPGNRAERYLCQLPTSRRFS